jgi:hypothetical protein
VSSVVTKPHENENGLFSIPIGTQDARQNMKYGENINDEFIHCDVKNVATFNELSKHHVQARSVGRTINAKKSIKRSNSLIILLYNEFKKLVKN